MDAWKLAERHTMEELQSMLKAAMEAPESKNDNPASLMIYNRKASKRIDAICDAISLHLKQRKIDSGTYKTEGYSGRNSNRC
jgi:hypothetical protein